MLVIALTGGIGSGKTTVSDIFKSKNSPVIDTDIIARQIVEPDKPAYSRLINIFGKEILDAEKNINRQALRELVFRDTDKRQRLENILHPLIWEEVCTQLSSIRSNSTETPYCIIVVPLLFENKSSKIRSVQFDRILVIDSPESTQIKRVTQRDNVDKVMVENMMATQASRQTRQDGADDIILNNDNIEHLQDQVEILHRYYLELNARS